MAKATAQSEALGKMITRRSLLFLFVYVAVGVRCGNVIDSSDNTIDESVAVEVEIGELFWLLICVVVIDITLFVS